MPSCARACEWPVASPSGRPVQTFQSVPPEYSTKRFSVPGASRVNSADNRVGPKRAVQSDGMRADAAFANELVCRQRTSSERVRNVEAHDLGEYLRGPRAEQHLEQDGVRRFFVR